jgi:TRAP-type C4-dicarboxylate transport system permease small subunit
VTICHKKGGRHNNGGQGTVDADKAKPFRTNKGWTMKIIKSLSRLMNYAACGMLAAMMLLTVSDVFLRYFFRRPILGTTELTESMMACLAFFAFAWCAVQKSHLKVDLVMSRFSPRVQAVVDSITSFVGLLMVALIAWRSFVEAMAVKQLNIISSLLKIPAFPFYYVVSLGCAVLGLVMAAQMIQNIEKAAKG